LNAPLVRVDRVAKRFGEVVAVDGVTLEIARGEFFALLGPSGCGKTTLLRLLAGFETPDAGTIAIDGEDMTGVPPYRRPVNMMFQSYALFPHMSVAANIGFGLRQQGLSRAEIEPRVARLLDLVELAGLGGRRPTQLSGGQRQRVALARALAREPKLLLLDEPLAALDRKLRARTQVELVSLQRRLGLTFVVVTHDQEEALGMASRIAVMEKGRLAQVGMPAEIYDRPASRFVADFIGEVNLFEGETVLELGGYVTIRTPDGEIQGIGTSPVAALAVRPEAIRVSMHPYPIQLDGNDLCGRLEALRFRGDDSIAHVRLDSGKVVRAKLPRKADDISIGSDVLLSWAPSDTVVLAQ
jgi:putrescine transport system ATP-binding protein